MKLWIKGVTLLLALGIGTLITGCLLVPDSGSDQGTEVDIVPALTPDPNTYVCNPTGDFTQTLPRSQGIRASLYYLDSSQPRYGAVDEYLSNGHLAMGIDSSSGNSVEIAMYFNQIFVPTRPFDRGFKTHAGQTLVDENGTTLYEYFSIRHEGRLQLGSKPEGLYQLAILSDDGAKLRLDNGSGYETLIDNDGNHPTKMGCAVAPVQMNADSRIPYVLDYYQGPRYHISLVMLWRPWPASASDPLQPASVAEARDAFCGSQGNSFYFNSTVDPPAPSANYNALLSRGWEPVNAENYLLPGDDEVNPCNTPAPVISNFRVVTIESTSVTFAWETDVPASSMVNYRLASDTVEYNTVEDLNLKTSHQVTVSGLISNTDYVMKGISASSSGLSSESDPRTIRTRR